MQLRRYPGSEAVLFKSERTESGTQKDQVKEKPERCSYNFPPEDGDHG